MTELRRHLVRALCLAAALAVAMGAVGCGDGSSDSATGSSGSATQQSATATGECEGYPSEDIELVVPYSPGGGFDTWARLLAPALEERLPGDASVVVVNRPGAGGLSAITDLFAAEPDGHVIAITEPGILVTSQLAGTTPIDVTELSAIGQVAFDSEVILVPADSPWQSIEDVQQAAESGDPVKMATAGLAAINVVTFDALGIPFEEVVHEGSSEAMLSLIRGDTDITIFPLVSALENLQSGDLSPLLVVRPKPAEGEPGAAQVTDVPTLDEVTGQEGLGTALAQHRILVAPPETPACMVQMLSDALVASLNDPQVVEQAKAAELFPKPADAAETQAIVENVSTTLQGYQDLLNEALEG